ncbi:hypothetical protein [Botrimarina sp.]|uniref:hypothetical protein n=1 Tax=Botrimarina sp. TaxID=2795802 RepID=UPI0032EDC41C
MTYTGRVQNGVVVLDDKGLAPPEGAAVRVELVEEPTRPTIAERLKNVIGKAEGMPPDAASRIDDYLYGASGE